MLKNLSDLNLHVSSLVLMCVLYSNCNPKCNTPWNSMSQSRELENTKKGREEPQIYNWLVRRTDDLELQNIEHKVRAILWDSMPSNCDICLNFN